jgi:hypothetical protein
VHSRLSRDTGKISEVSLELAGSTLNFGATTLMSQASSGPGKQPKGFQREFLNVLAHPFDELIIWKS